MKSKLSKLEKAAREAKQRQWDTFIDTLNSYLPQQSHELFRSLEELKLGVTDPQEAACETELLRLYTLTSLDQALWGTWYENITQYLGDDEDFTLYPQQLPKPPHDPTAALEVMKSLEYPLDPLGVVRFDFCFFLSAAKAITELYSVENKRTRNTPINPHSG